MEKAISKTEVKWKASKYNHFFPFTESQMLAYNAFSNSFAVVGVENIDKINKILESPDITSRKPELESLKTNLIKSGFLIDNRLDEFEILKSQNLVGRFANRTLNITVAPTLKCNFSCSYCFEEKDTSTMTKEVEEAFVKFLERKMINLNGLYLSWFGGEPLLEIDLIERVMESAKEICIKNKAHFHSASIITNGFLLTKDVALRLKNANVTDVQITLDGPPEIHDKRRILNNGKGTFSTILNNIKNSMELLRFVIRINIDKSNELYLKEFLEILKAEGLSKKVPCYLGKVVSNTTACADIAKSCLNTKEFSETIVKKCKEMCTLGFSNLMYPSLHKSGFCTADNLNGYVVSPSGFLYKCWEQISDNADNSVGSLFNEKKNPTQIMNSVNYLNWDPFSLDKCKACNIFPICVGGCVYNKIYHPKMNDCSEWKYNLYDILKLNYMEFQKNKGE